MFTLLTLGALLAASFVNADPNPTEPGPTDVYNAGGQCRIVWTPDPTGVWKTMNIELMTGSNLQMVHLTTVATVDGTSATATPFTYPCPAVKPNSAIYFYQFTSPAANTTLWTTRFTLADATGGSTPPTEATQPTTNEPIPWGTGALVNPADAKPPPGGAAATSGNATTPAAVSSTAGTTSVTPAAVPPPSALAASSTSSSSSSSSEAPTVTGTTSSNKSSAAGVIIVDDRIWKAAVALVAAAVTFTVAM